MRTESPAVLAIGGTLVIHAVLGLLGYLLVDWLADDEQPIAQKVLIEVEVETSRPLPPLPAPLPEREAPELAPEPPPPAPEPKPQRMVQRRASSPAPPPDVLPPPPSDLPPSNDSGGGPPVTTMAEIAPGATGVAVARGPRNTGRVGRGGSGGGTGTGTGAGSSDAPAAPVSIATIKTRALPKGDFSYFDASKDYPTEAKSLGIEGVIRVRLVVDAEGVVKSAVLLNKLGHGLDDLALARAKKILFEPARDTDDKSVSSVVVWTFTMTLPK